jgi:nitroimidazol reductase NimA-like FMN-containing flavoprotein (pyridoxamine 5'-phosphate oxidase superfamily)
VHAVLDEALVCHVGFVVDGEPVVLPQLHARVGDRLYLHGSTDARALHTARTTRLPVCVTVTTRTDGLVLARSAFHHSINYRSVAAHGTSPRRTARAARAGVRGAARTERCRRPASLTPERCGDCLAPLPRPIIAGIVPLLVAVRHLWDGLVVLASGTRHAERRARSTVIQRRVPLPR